eukprot:13809631-Ditylum_brightwellii.AAC.1
MDPKEDFTKVFLKHYDLIRVVEIIVKIKELKVKLEQEEEKDKNIESEVEDNSTKSDDAIVVEASQINKDNENSTQNNDVAVVKVVLLETL